MQRTRKEKDMEKYLGIFNNNSEVKINSYCLDNDIDQENLSNSEYDFADTVAAVIGIAKVESDKKFVHLYEATTDCSGITTYKYFTSKIIDID